MLLAYGHFDAVLGVAKDNFEVLIISLKYISLLVISVDTNVQDFSVFMWRHLNLEVQHGGFVSIFIYITKVDVRDDLPWLAHRACVVGRLI